MTEPQQLTSLQLAILRILWDVGEVSVNDMVRRLGAERPLAPTTVATILSRLEKRGIVGRRREGRLFLYRPLIEREDARRTKVDELARDLFEGDVSHLVHHLLSSKEIHADDLAWVKAMIEKRERDEQQGGVL